MKKWIGYVAAGMIGAAAGSTLLSVARADFGGGHGFGHRGGFFRHHGDPEKAREHAQMAVGFALKMVDATDEQREKASAIVARHFEGADGLRAQHVANRQEAVQALSGPSVDREKLESVRKAQIKLADDASQRLTSAVAELAEVLTPEQRAELLRMAERFHR